MLDELQASIQRPHVDENLSVLFFHSGDQGEGRTFLRGLTVVVPEFLPGNHDYFGVFDDELPGAFYFIKYWAIP